MALIVNLPPWLLKFRKVLGRVADVFIGLRNAGLVDRGKGPKF